MNFEEIETAIASAVRIGVGSTLDVGWDHRTNRWRDAAHVRLRLQSMTPIGDPEKRYRDVGGDMRERTYGVRRLVVQVQCETQAQAASAGAHYLADRVLAGLGSSFAEDALAQAEVGSARVFSPPREVSYRDEQSRWRSAVVFELAFNTHSVFEYSEADIGHIRQAELSGTFEDANTEEYGPVMIPEDA